MSTPLYMTMEDAVELVRSYADLHTEGDVLAGLKAMQSCYDDLDKADRVAYNMFMRAGREMFAPQEQ